MKAATRQTGLKGTSEKGISIFGLLYSHFPFYYPEENTKGLVIISGDSISLSFSKPSCQCPSLPVTCFLPKVGLSCFPSIPQGSFTSGAAVMSEVKQCLCVAKADYICTGSQMVTALNEEKGMWKTLQNSPEIQCIFL